MRRIVEMVLIVLLELSACSGTSTAATTSAPTPSLTAAVTSAPTTPATAPTPDAGCNEGIQSDAEGVRVCCPDDCFGVCDDDEGCDLDPSCCPSSIANSDVYCDTDGVSPPCIFGSATSSGTAPTCSCEQESESTRVRAMAISGAAFGVALFALVARCMRKEQERSAAPPSLQGALLKDDYRSAHVVISCVELALSVLNAFEQDALQLGSATKLVFATSAIMELWGFIFAIMMLIVTEHTGGVPILCIWEAYYNESKWKSVKEMIRENPNEHSSRWVQQWVETVSKAESENLWRVLLLYGVGPQVLVYWVLAGLNAIFFAPTGSTSTSLIDPASFSFSSFSFPDDVVSLDGLLFFAVMLYATVLGALVGLYRCFRSCGWFGGRRRDEFYVVYYSVYAVLIATEVAEGILIFSGAPASPAAYMLASLDLFLAVPAMFFVIKHMSSDPVREEKQPVSR